jgi:hypothetical protein
LEIREVGVSKTRYYSIRTESASYGVTFGSALAIVVSYDANHSIPWAIVDGVFGWFYILYFLLK